MELIVTLPLKGNTLRKEEIEYIGNFGHTIGRIQHIDPISRIDICYATYSLATQTVAPNIPGFQGIKRCAQYMASHPHKPIFYPSDSYDVSNFIKITWSEDQVEDYTIYNSIKYHQDVNHTRIINRKSSFSGILHTLLDVDVC